MRDDRPLVEFDHHSVEFQEHACAQLAELRRTCPVGWTNTYGGYWVLSSYEHVWNALRSHEVFSSAKRKGPDGKWAGGDVIPDTQNPPIYPLDIDPPEWNDYRRVLTPWLSPAAVEARRDRLESLAAQLFDGFADTGKCDMIHDFGNPLPALATLDLVGLDLGEWQRWAEPHHAIQYAPPGSAEHDAAFAGLTWQRARLAEAIVDRRERPRNDLVTAVANAQVCGRPMTPDDGAALLLTVIGGGVDTTTAVFANSLLHLQRHPDDRAWLLADLDARLPTALEELLRMYPPVQAVARTVTREFRIGDALLRPGERVAVAVLSANFDEHEFDAPAETRLDRFPNRHATFGIGIHRCVGSYAARLTASLMMRTVLTRAADYRIDEEACVRYSPTATLDGWIRMPATFTPAAKAR